MNEHLKRIFEAKEQFRKEQAKLPYEEKINILGRLQRRAREIKSKTSNPTIEVNKTL